MVRAESRRLTAHGAALTVADVLLGAARGEPVPEGADWAEVDAAELQLAAIVHGVAPALYLHLRDDSGVPEAVLRRLQVSYRDQLARHLRSLSDLRTAARALDDAGITWAAVKGPVLAEHVWPRPDMRAYTDVDLVVDRRRFADTLAALQSAGARLVDRNWPLIRDQRRAEVTLALPYGTSLDLHWHLVNDPATRRAFSFQMDELFERRQVVELGGVHVPTLDPADTLLHLAYHMAHSGGHRLVWLMDFQLAAQRPGVEWDAVLARSSRYGCRLALDLTMRRVERALGRSRPSNVRTGPFMWSWVAAAADRWRPVPQLPSSGQTSGRIVFQSTRDSSARSLAAAARAVLRSRDDAEAGADNPLHLDVDDAGARETYLALVQGLATP